MKKILYKNRWQMAIYILTTCGEIISEILWAYVFMITFNFATGKALIRLEQLIIISLGIIAFRGVISYWNDMQLERTVILCTKDLKETLLNCYIDSQGEKSGSEILNIITQISLRVEELYLRPLFSIIRGVIFFVGASVAIFQIQKVAFFVILVLSWIPIVVPQMFNRRNRTLREASMKQSEYYLAKMKEITTGFDVIKSFHIETRMKKLAQENNERNEQSRFAANRFQIFQNSFSGVLSLTTFIVTQLVSVILAYQHLITIGDVIAITQLSNYIAQPIMIVPRNLMTLNSMKGEVQKLEAYVSEKTKISANQLFVFDKQLIVQELSFSYDDKQVLDHISLNVKKNQKIAIVGESGSGKSTLAKVLLRRLPKYTGTIQFDNQELRDIAMDSFYANIAPVTQQVFLFNDTIRNNITLYESIDEDRLMQVVKNSGLLTVIEKLPDGLDTVIGEYGTELSGGKKQRISIARCLIKDAALILMDEATSSLDQHTARDIEQTLLNLNTTVLAITHRVDEYILKQFDRIYVLSEGKILENGVFDELEFFKNTTK